MPVTSVAAAPRPAPPRWLAPLVLAVTALAFLPTLDGGFIADDFVYIVRFSDFPWTSWPRLFTHEWSEGIWGQPLRELRPVTALAFMSDARLFGGYALGYRLANLGLHLAAVFIVLRLAWHYTRGLVVPTLLGALVFALHPAHVEAVAWITGRVDLLATTSALLFWIAAEFYSDYGRRAQLAIAIAALAFGLFAKELCMFAPALLLLRWLLLDPGAGRAVWKRRIMALIAAGIAIGVYAACRRAAFGPENLGYNVWTDKPAWDRQASYASWLVPILPFTGLGEWKENLPSIALLHGVWIALAAAILVGATVALIRRQKAAAGAWYFGGIWYLATVAPLTAVVYMSPRHLYFPSVGLALAVAFFAVGARWRSAVAAVLVLWCAAGHVAAIQPWRTAANTSRDALTALDRELATAGPGAIAVTSVPATLGPVLLWVWSSPQCVSPPFLAHPPAAVIEQPVNISRPVDWHQARRPLETVNAAPAIVALYVDGQGKIACRRVPDAELPKHREVFAQLMVRGINPDSWGEWVKAVAGP